MFTHRMISRIFSLFFIVIFMLALVGPAYAAPALPAGTAETTSLLQYTSGNHILGFAPGKVYLAGLDHALTVEFIGGQGHAPRGTAASGSAEGSVPALERVEYREAWPGVDVIYTSASGGLAESTYLVKSGARPADIRLKYNAPARLMENGALRFAFENGHMTESAPIAFQVIDGKRLPVEVHFTLSDGLVGFAVGPYDPKHLLTIDPLYAWHAFYGSALYEDRGQAMASDSSGNVYVAGTSYDTWIGPGSELPLNPHAGGADIVVVKMNATGVYQWHTFFGSTDDDFGNSIVSDPSGNVVIAGKSEATWDGPAPTSTSPLNTYAGDSDITALKLDSAGAYVWHTFYGSASADIGNAIALDGSGNLIITGFSDAEWNGPGTCSTAGVSPCPLNAFTTGLADIVVLKLDSAGAYTWHTFYGSANLDYGNAVTTDGSGYIYVTGQSRATFNGPGTCSTAGVSPCPLNAFTTGEYDIIVFKLDGAGAYLWHTFYGSTNYDFGDAIISVGSDIFVAGISNGAWGSPLRAYLGNGDLVLLKLTNAGAKTWHTFYGSAVGSDQAQAITSDGTFIYIAGYSGASWNGPGSAPPDNPYAGGLDIMALKLRASDGFYQWHTFFGFGDPDPNVLQEDQAFAITTFGAGNVLVAGSSLAAWDGPGSTAPLNAYAGTGDIVFINLDSTQPAVTVNQTAGQADPTTVPSINFTAVFSEPINPASFTNTDIVTTCSKTPCSRSVVVSEIAPNDDTTFNIAVTISGVTDLDPRTITASISAGAVTDLTGNGNSSSTSTDNSVVYKKDITPPSLQLYKQITQPEPTSASPINFKVVFSEAIKVSTFTSADVTMGGTSSGTRTAVITEISPNNGTAFNIAVSGMVGDGTVTATIPAGVVTDLAGNANLASTDLDNDVIFEDETPPDVTVDQAPSPQTDPTTDDTIKFRAVFSEPINVSTFTTGDITLGGTAPGAPLASINQVDSTTFDITVTGMTDSGTVTASIGPGLVADPSAAANLNTASTSTDNSVEFILDTTAPTVTVEQAAGQEDPTTDWTIHFTATFTDGPIDGPIDIATFTSGDIDLSGSTTPGTLTAIVSEIAPNDGTTFDIAVSGMTGDGTVTALIAATTVQDLAGNWNAASTSADNSVDYDFIPQFNSSIPAPTLRSPRTNTLTNNAAPTFWWTNVRGGQNYEIVFATDSAFTSIVRSAMIIGSTSYTPAPLLGDTKYYWRVRAYNAINQYGRWSTARIITIDTTGPSAPVLTSPTDDAFIRSGIFRWASVPTAVSYQFQLDNDADFSSPVISSIVRGASRRLPAMPTGAYYWRVRARDAAGNWGAWSAEYTVNFTGP